MFPGDRRTIADFRRSGAVEVIARQASRETLARKMANTVDSNAELERTYLPNVASVVRLAYEARSCGREVLRAGVKRNGSGT